LAWTRDDFTYLTPIPTRWNDNDMLGHVNNVIYYSYFEAVVVRFLMEKCGVDWSDDRYIPYAAENLCRYKKPVAFPEELTGAMRIDKIGNTSFTYDLALFSEKWEEPAAEGHWVHVFVDRQGERPVPIPEDIRAKLVTYQK